MLYDHNAQTLDRHAQTAERNQISWQCHSDYQNAAAKTAF